MVWSYWDLIHPFILGWHVCNNTVNNIPLPLAMDHTEELDHTVELHHAASFYCGSCHKLDIDGASSRPQLAGREVAFYTNRHFNFEHTVSQSSCHREELQITRGPFTPVVVLCKMVIFTWGSGRVLGRFARIRPLVSSHSAPSSSFGNAIIGHCSLNIAPTGLRPSCFALLLHMSYHWNGSYSRNGSHCRNWSYCQTI